MKAFGAAVNTLYFGSRNGRMVHYRRLTFSYALLGTTDQTLIDKWKKMLCDKVSLNSIYEMMTVLSTPLEKM